MQTTHEPALFEEEQQFRQFWLWALLIVAVLGPNMILLIGLYRQFFLGESFGETPIPDRSLILTSLFFFALTGGVLWLFYKIKLSVRLDGRLLHVHFFPLRKRDILIADIRRWSACRYRPVLEFGGWGIKYSLWSRTWAYNVSGNEGVRLELTNGKRLLIGSQRAKEFAEAIRKAKGM